MIERAASRRLRAVAAIAAVAGAALFAWSLRRAGVADVLDGIRRLGAGFAAIAALGGVRYLLRAVAWRLSFEGAAPTIADAFATFVAGDALGNVTPFGVLVSEPSKVMLLRDRVAPAAVIPALAIENLFYGVTVVAMLVAGTATLLLAFPVPHAVRIASLAVLASTVVAAAIMIWLITARVRFASRLAARVGIDAERLRGMEDRVFQFTERHPRRLLPLLALEASYHVAAVFEIWLALTLMTGTSPSVVTAFALEYVNRSITIVFQFVPMWIGVDEAGTGLVTAALGIGPAAGVGLALARKGRILLWTAIGLAFWWPRPRASSTAPSPAPASSAHRPPEQAPAATRSPVQRL